MEYANELPKGADSELVTLFEWEKRFIIARLHYHGGHKTLAAKSLGIGRATLYRKLSEYQQEEKKK